MFLIHVYQNFMHASTRNSIFIQYWMRIQTFTDVQNTHTPAGMLQIKMRYTMHVLSYAKSFRLNNFYVYTIEINGKLKRSHFHYLTTLSKAQNLNILQYCMGKYTFMHVKNMLTIFFYSSWRCDTGIITYYTLPCYIK